MIDSPSLVCCGVLRNEIDSLVARHHLPVAPRYLDANLCCDYHGLAKALQHALSGPAGSPAALVFGLCHPAIDKIASRHGARRVQASNCISMLIGEDAYVDAVARRKYLMLPGWVSRWRASLVDDLGLDLDVARQLLSDELDEAVFLDTGVAESPGRLLDEFAAFSGLSVERRLVGLDHLKEVIAEAIDGD